MLSRWIYPARFLAPTKFGEPSATAVASSHSCKSFKPDQLLRTVDNLVNKKPGHHPAHLIDLILGLLERNYLICDSELLTRVLGKLNTKLEQSFKPTRAFFVQTDKLTQFFKRFLEDRDKRLDLTLLGRLLLSLTKLKLVNDTELSNLIFNKATHLMESLDPKSEYASQALNKRTVELLMRALVHFPPNAEKAEQFYMGLRKFTKAGIFSKFFSTRSLVLLTSSLHSNRFDSQGRESFNTIPIQIWKDIAREIKEERWGSQHCIHGLRGIREATTLKAQDIKRTCLDKLAISEIQDPKLLNNLLCFFRASMLNGEFDQERMRMLPKFLETLKSLGKIKMTDISARIMLRELDILQFYLGQKPDRFSQSLKDEVLKVFNKNKLRAGAKRDKKRMMQESYASEYRAMELIKPLLAPGLIVRKARSNDIDGCFFDMDLVVIQRGGKVLCGVEVDGAGHKQDTDIPDSLRDQFILDKYKLPTFRLEMNSHRQANQIELKHMVQAINDLTM